MFCSQYKSFLVLGLLFEGMMARGIRAADAKGPELPLKKVVMFSSGVGYFERRGDVEGNAKVELKFNVRDINDLLKSLVLQDMGGGQISTVTYASKDPITRTLQSFAIDLTANPTLSQLLDQVRGERIEIEAPDAITGVILGVERRKQPVDKDKIVEVEYLNLLTDKGLRSVPLASVGRIKLTNERLDAELRQALAVLATGHDKDKKSVTLEFLGKAKRGVRVGYIHESPIWKTSYRLVLREKEGPMLQGWAIVENTTDADWDNVDLTLVSGRPISFVMDLYDPLYMPRPRVEPELFASLRPPTYDQDLVNREKEFRAAGDRARSRGAQPAETAALGAAPTAKAARRAGANAGRLLREELKDEALAALDPTGGVQTAAQASELGELFQYAIANPVTLARQRSAMLPIVNESVKGEKVSIYNAQVHAKHPLAGLKLVNSTKLHLLQGPVTVFDGGAYAGDARISDLQPGSERLVSYAIDLGTEVAPEAKSHPQRLVSVSILKGVLNATYKYARETNYTVKNSGDTKKKMLVEYPLDANWKLIAPKEPAEKTRDLYRFAVDADPGKPAKLNVQEEQVVSQQFALVNLDDNRIGVFISAPDVSDSIKKALREVVRRKQEIAQLVAQRAELERQANTIRQQQERIRENLKVVTKDSDIGRTYLKKFTEQESQIDALEGRITDSIAREQKLRKDLDEYLIGLDLK
jgi:hypothetical protein